VEILVLSGQRTGDMSGVVKPWGNQVHAMTLFFFLTLLLAAMPSPPTDAATVRAVWLAGRPTTTRR